MLPVLVETCWLDWNFASASWVTWAFIITVWWYHPSPSCSSSQFENAQTHLQLMLCVFKVDLQILKRKWLSPRYHDYLVSIIIITNLIVIYAIMIITKVPGISPPAPLSLQAGPVHTGQTGFCLSLFDQAPEKKHLVKIIFKTPQSSMIASIFIWTSTWVSLMISCLSLSTSSAPTAAISTNLTDHLRKQSPWYFTKLWWSPWMVKSWQSDDQTISRPGWPGHINDQPAPAKESLQDFRISGFQDFRWNRQETGFHVDLFLAWSLAWNTIDRPLFKHSSYTHLPSLDRYPMIIDTKAPIPMTMAAISFRLIWRWWAHHLWKQVGGELRTGSAPPPPSRLRPGPGTHKATPGQSLGTQGPPRLQGRQNIKTEYGCANILSFRLLTIACVNDNCKILHWSCKKKYIGSILYIDSLWTY